LRLRVLGPTSAVSRGEWGKDFVKTGCKTVATISGFDWLSGTYRIGTRRLIDTDGSRAQYRGYPEDFPDV